MKTKNKPQAVEVVAPNLTPAERDSLQACVDNVLAERRQYFVRVTNRKVTKSKKRMPGVDYDPKRGLAPNAHEGWLVTAALNKQEQLYIHLFDEARAKQPDDYGHTRVTMRGIQSFERILDPETGLDYRPGPLASPEEVADYQAKVEAIRAAREGRAQAQAAPQQAPAVDPVLILAQTMIAQGQMLMQFGQALLALRGQQQAQQAPPLRY